MKRRMRVFHFVKLFLFASLCLVFSPQGWSQLTTTGTLNGTVTDASGASIPQAAVTVISEQTLSETQSQTNSDGSFVVAGLTPGRYKVTVVKTGFQTFTETGIVLNAAQVVTVNASLIVGHVTTTVNIQASAAQVQTSTPEVSNEVTEQEVSTLPLNGRNYQSLSFLMPGVTNLSPDTAQSQGGFYTFNTMSVNGMGQQGTMDFLDGVWNENTGSLNQNTIVPDPDQLQEVRLLQNNYSAQYSLNGSNVLLLETKSGTKAFHGSAFEYLRNDAFDARNFFSPTVPALKQNVFGYTLGGPVYIRGHYNTNKDKTFFFASSQWSVQHIGNTLLAPDPSAAMRNGTFTTPIMDPSTGQPFPQTSPGVYQIPQNRISTGALALMNAAEPLPNYPQGGFTDYLNNTPVITNTRTDEFKVDQNFGSKVRLMGEYFDERQTNLNPYQPLIGIPFNTTQQPILTDNQMAQIRATQLISPTMLNTTSISMNNYIVSLTYTGLVDRSQLPTFNEVLPYSGFLSNRLPTVGFAGGYPTMGVGFPFPEIHASDLENTLSDDWSWLRGNHYLRAGVQWVKGTKRQDDFAQTAGQWIFTGAFTKNPIADYVLGDATELIDVSTEYRGYNHYHIISPYLEDQWKATRRLTLTLGLRDDYSPPSGYQSDQKGFTNFEPSLYNPAEAPIVNSGGVIMPTPNYNKLNGIVFLGVTPGVPNNYTNEHVNYLNPTGGFAYDLFGNGKWSMRGGYGISHTQNFLASCQYQCENNYPVTSTLTLLHPGFPNATGGTAAPATAITLTSEALNISNPYVQTYSLGIQHQFGNWFASVTGAGSVLRNACGDPNLNQPVPEGGYDFNPLLNNPSNSPYATSLAGPAPYQGYGALHTWQCEYNADWNGLEVNVKHPVGHNVFFSGAYTWEHGVAEIGGTNIVGGASPQDLYHPSNDYGSEATSPAQILSLSGIWHIPAFSHARGWKNTVLGGWQYSDITNIQSGFPMTPGLSISTPGLATRPNRVASSIAGPKTVAEWFNTSAFAAPAAGFFGNAAPGSIIGPGTIDFDMALYKDFRIKERHTVEFRSEFFNIFNRTNFSSVSTAYGAGNFGRVTSARDPRILEFALRYQI